MAEAFPKDILLRVGGRTLQRHAPFAVPGARRGLIDTPITFSRADGSTCASQNTRDAVVRLAAAGVIRPEWIDTDGDGILDTPSILVEEARTNGWTHSQDTDNAAWTLNAITVGGTNATSPNAGANARWFLETVANSGHTLTRNTPTLTDNTQQSASWFVRGGLGRSWCRIRTNDKGGTTRDSWVNVDTGALGTVNAGHTIIVTRPFNNNFLRISVIFGSASGVSTPSAEIGPSSADAVTSYVGDVTKGLYIWGGDFEVDQKFPTAWIDTVASTITRAVDSFTIPFNFGAMDLTVFVRVWIPTGQIVGVNRPVFSLATANPRVECNINGIQSDVLIRDAASGFSRSQVNLPAGSLIQGIVQVKNFATVPAVATDFGAGLSAFQTGAAAITGYGNQTLEIGGRTGSGSDKLNGNVIDVMILRGLFSRAEAMAVA